MKSDALNELIERLERLDAPHWMVEQDIHAWRFDGVLPRDKPFPPPAYTASVDAALTLVPEGWSLYRLDQYHDRSNPAWGWGASLRYHARPDIGVAIGESRASMPIALCIAALRARIAQSPPASQSPKAVQKEGEG